MGLTNIGLAVNAAPSGGMTMHTIADVATPGTTRALTFLSAGYQVEADFLSDVAACMSALVNSTGGVAADPWGRYLPLFNVYAVYEASAQTGGSRPKSFDDSCTHMTHCGETTVRNNLNCAFGTPLPQFLSCDVNLVRSMASRAPSQDIVVVLLNDVDASGVGGNGIVYITNAASYMPLMLVHYLNRAVAGLHEEYSLNITATTGGHTFSSNNCAASGSSMEKSWHYWYHLDSWNETTESSAPDSDTEEVLASEGIGCSLVKYSSSTANSCIMRDSAVHHMCAVCKEHLSLSFHSAGVSSSLLSSPSTARLGLTVGRCPPPGYTYYVHPTPASSGTVTADVYLSIGAFGFQNDVPVTWTAADGTVLAEGDPVLHIANFMDSYTLPTTITASVKDATAAVRPSYRATKASTMTRTTTFTIEEWTASVDCSSADAQPSCFASRSTFASLTDLPSDVCALGTDSTSSSSTSNTVNLKALDLTSTKPEVDEVAVLISVIVCVAAAVIVIVVVTFVFGFYVRRHPREVLDPTRGDRFVYHFLIIGSGAGIMVALFQIAFTFSLMPLSFVLMTPMLLALLAFSVVEYILMSIILASVLYRWFRTALWCGILAILVGLVALTLGLYLVITHRDSNSQAAVDSAHAIWLSLLSSTAGNNYVCENLQSALKCSGFHAGCFMTLSAECPTSCTNNDYYVNACGGRFTHYLGGVLSQTSIAAMVSSGWHVLIGAIAIIYYARFRRLPANGRMRRTFRQEPLPPMPPLSHYEVIELRRMFSWACEPETNTLEGESAVNFLTIVFSEHFSDRFLEVLRGGPALTFSALMSLYFPYIIDLSVNPEPDMALFVGGQVGPLTPGHSRGGNPPANLMSRFVEVSGTLSPGKLQDIFRAHIEGGASRSGGTLLADLRKAAARCPSIPFLRGLSQREIEGLRGVWSALHPDLSGSLTDDDLQVLYRWTHAGAPPLDATGLMQWRSSLDVSKSNRGIGWSEFCYPYAQRALLRSARTFLEQNGCSVPRRMVTRRSVAAAYEGVIEYAECFLPYEEAVPLARVVAHLLTRQRTLLSSNTPASRLPMAQRALDIEQVLRRAS